MKRIERKGRIFQTIIAICVVFSMVLGSSAVSYAATPTLDSEFATLVVGTNDLKIENYDGSQTLAGCFTAPEKGNYKFYAVNIGEHNSRYVLLNNNFSREEDRSYFKTGEQCNFKMYSLEQGQKMYFYAESGNSKTYTLAVRFVIEKEEKKSDTQVNNTPASTNTSSKKTTVSKEKVSISKKKLLSEKRQKNKTDIEK